MCCTSIIYSSLENLVGGGGDSGGVWEGTRDGNGDGDGDGEGNSNFSDALLLKLILFIFLLDILSSLRTSTQSFPVCVQVCARTGLSNLGMEFLSRNTPSNLAGTH